MGKGKGGRRPRRYLKGSVDERTLLTTLAARTLVSANMDESVAERTLISSLVANYAMDGLTDAADVGPIMFGVAHSDYSDAEIEEVIENAGSWDEGDLINQERAKRKVRILGIFDTPPASTETSVLNDGKPMKTKLNWILLSGDTLKFWAFNMGQAAVATTVPNIYAQGHANLWPQ